MQRVALSASEPDPWKIQIFIRQADSPLGFLL